MSENNDKIKGVVPKDQDMKSGFEEILNADKYIIISLKYEDGGIRSRIRHETNLKETVEELEHWADIMKGEIQASEEMREILRKNKIGD